MIVAKSPPRLVRSIPCLGPRLQALCPVTRRALTPARAVAPLRPQCFHQVTSADSREGSEDEDVHTKRASASGSKSSAVNRKRIVIKPIADERSRVGTYNKRKFGVIKKAMELSILCNCKIGLFIFGESGKPVRYCSDGDFRTLLSSVSQGGSSSSRSEVWDNSMYSSFNRGFGSSSKGDDDFCLDPPLLHGLPDVEGGAAKRRCGESAAGANQVKQEARMSPANQVPLGTVAPPLRVASPLVLSAASTMHNRSQVFSGPSFSAAPVPYSTSLDDYYLGSSRASSMPFAFDDHGIDQLFDAPNVHGSYDSSFAAQEVDDNASPQSGTSAL